MNHSYKKFTFLTFLLLSFYLTSSFAQTERWVYSYNGPGNDDDEAYSIAYGEDGNIYSAGYSSGNGTGEDFTVISLTPSGSERWVYTYNGQGSLSDIAYDIVTGSDGNIYAVGKSTGTSSGMNITIVSVTAGGIERWVYVYDGPMSDDDEAFSIAYGLDSNIYVAGRSRGIGTENDFTIISVDTAGSERWVYRFDRDKWNDCACSITYGLDNNIYAAGYTYAWIPTQEFTLLSVDTTGAQRWIKTIAGSGVVNETALSITCGSDSNLYAVGSSWVYHYTVASIDTTGVWRWTRYYGEIGHDNRAKSVVQGQDRNIYSAGYIQIGTDYDFTVAAHTSAGDSMWVMIYDGPSNAHDVASSVVYGHNGSIYAAGWSAGIGSNDDFVVIDVDTTGYQRWVYRYNGLDDGLDRAYSIAYGSDDNIYAAGCCYDSTTNNDFLVISLDTTTTSIVENDSKTILSKELNFPTYIMGAFLLPEGKKCKVFDITGRVVAPDIIQPGIYFIEIDGMVTQKVVKVR